MSAMTSSPRRRHKAPRGSAPSTPCRLPPKKGRPKKYLTPEEKEAQRERRRAADRVRQRRPEYRARVAERYRNRRQNDPGLGGKSMGSGMCATSVTRPSLSPGKSNTLTQSIRPMRFQASQANVKVKLTSVGVQTRHTRRRKHTGRLGKKT